MSIRPIVTGLGAGALALVAALPGMAAAPGFTMLPGGVAGEVQRVGMQRGETTRWLAMRYGVSPVRVKPALDSSGRGYGVVHVDTRHVVPSFDVHVEGIVLNVPEAEVYLVRGGEIVKHYPVAVSAPDKPVRIGLTQVVHMEKNPSWYIPPSIQKEMGRRTPKRAVVPPGPRNPLGPRWIGFWDGSYGMHGTNNPTSIKQYASHGCVRFRAGDIKDLYDRVYLGTPIRVVYQPVVMGVDEQSIWVQVYPDIYRRGFDYRGAVAELAKLAGVQDRLNWAAANRAIARHDGIIANVGPGGAFREAEDPTATIEEAMAGGAKPGAAPAPVYKPTPKPQLQVEPQPTERLIPEDQMPVANPEPYEAPPESAPAPWYTQP
jgi:L,D-transpeptidase ErfK/SrfK